mgnify:CR=1 FL=1
MLDVFFQYEFLRNALWSGVIVGLVSPVVGVFLVVRRLSLMADALSHIALSGIAAGLLLREVSPALAFMSPTYSGMAFSVIGSLFVERLRKVYKSFEELAIPITLSTGVALSVVLISIADGFNSDLFGYLFGSVLSVTTSDLITIGGIGVIVLIAIFAFYKELFYLTFDEESAVLSGLPRKRLNLLFMVLVALVIAASMRIVGILLVSAMMTLPVAASLQVARSFSQTLVYAVVFAESAVLGGLVLSYYLDWASGGTIVLFSVIILCLVLLVKKRFVNV